jgi:uncharacterized SAM-binding protein YcdF (DUF218 family)
MTLALSEMREVVLDPRKIPSSGKAVIWLLCHYPGTPEADERVQAAASVYFQSRLPIWLYGSSSARYPDSVERLLKHKLAARGVPSDAVICSDDVPGTPPSLDTVQEAINVATTARATGIKTLICISNRLQLLQVKALLRREPLTLVEIPTPLRDWRWWYVMSRLALVPLAFMGVGRQFLPLTFVRWARANFSFWPF